MPPTAPEPANRATSQPAAHPAAPPAWERLASAEGGSVTALAATAATDGAPQVYAATALGVFRSTDGGRRWAPLGELGALTDVAAVLPWPPDGAGTRLHAGARGGLYRWRAQQGVWEHLLRASRVLSLLGVAGRPGHAGGPALLVGTEEDGILLSQDEGRTWSGANPGLLDLTVLALAASPRFAEDGLAFAATTSGLYRTRNGAESWRLVELDEEDVAVQCVAVSPSFAADRLVLAGTEEHGLLRSEDGGRSWDTVPELEGRSVNALAFGPGGRVAAATDAGLALSTDGGRSWRPAGTELGPVLSVALLAGDTGAKSAGAERTDDRAGGDSVRADAAGADAAGGDGVGAERTSAAVAVTLLAGLPGRGVVRSSNDGGSWAASSAGLTAGLFAGLAVVPLGGATDARLVIASLEDGLRLSDDGGRTWTAATAGLPDPTVYQLAAWCPADGPPILLAATAGGLAISHDAARSWQPALSGDDAVTPALTLAAAPDGTHLLAALAGGRLLASEDGGRSWAGLEAPGAGAEIVALALAPAFRADGTLYAATAGPAAPDGPAEVVVWRSADRGRTWLPWLEARGAPPVQLVALPTTPLGPPLLVGLGGQVLRPLRDAAEVRAGRRRPLWQPAALPGGPRALAGLAASPSVALDRTLFLATSAGIFVSRDGGERFVPWREGLEPLAVVAVVPSPAYAADRLVYALGLGGTVWRRRDA